MEEVVIIDALRTPIGKFRGMYKEINAVDLATKLTQELFNRHPQIKDRVDQTIFGQVLQAGSGQNTARQISLNAGLDQAVPAMTINEVCGSGLKAIILAMEQIQLGKAQVVLAGGTENMTNAPHVSQYDKASDSYTTPKPVMLVDGLTDALSGKHMGLTAENVAELYQITRQAQDEYAFNSQKKAQVAQESGWFKEEIVPITVGQTIYDQDESIRFDTSLDKLAQLKTVFKEDGTVTAGNASPINDGASAVILAAKSYAVAHNIPYLATIKATSEIGIDPAIMGISPIKAIQSLMEKADISLSEVDLFEINEAFAASSIVVAKELAIPEEKVNIAGGAIALGHPIGASGARILTTLIHQLRRINARFGVASLCIGGGLGLAMLIEVESIDTFEKKKFQQLSSNQRRDYLKQQGYIDATTQASWSEIALPVDVFEHLIENQVTDFALPLGIVPEFVVNDQTYYVPFVTEEPSVVAACSYAAKMARSTGGFRATMEKRWARGQIVVADLTLDAAEELTQWLIAHEQELIQVANDAYPSIVKRGGGIRAIETRLLDEGHLMSIDVLMDTKDAMGANMLNTVLEALAAHLKAVLDIEVLFAILTNYNTEAVVKAQVEIPFHQLDKLGEGKKVAQKIAMAASVAKLDPYRAVTHNKGIMNGIDALVSATGNDTRACAAAIHAYAARNGSYQGLTDWQVRDNVLYGSIELPLLLATVGGATKILPRAKEALELLDLNDAVELSQLAAAVGLAQNLAALRAIVSEGIQKGHMKMQARSLAMSVGAKGEEIKYVSQKLLESPMNQAQASAILTDYRKKNKL
ncbi:hydroxymethylglutaryl-CoA reductase, degradative [Enterococcus columbae]|uniref:acetyl-CoA C-acetyltransferase n=1 Tax=Enterococcus columbae DSM 7374 = ATCC 51263 TaxID=1121865 RepID=S0KQV4_9ENTE|nr:hydroxymethylglutaryl-CoA reductase, degradative [Enterococcus columbae]EOT42508.1 hydroxymethylglutaryl-CoA reductase, degradative [Enterococcus columbae DSM 7374 = ATCC 51263]EOW87556.1 hydroxymethylglutaryl-CoA reductase, degradative [Enterococcus columbae DSM 7374 = ATCC 51263]OJG23110.1 hydroxymethylglutaryl-CoA reductase, degradative [Enterococcus columbae DSM 7374 = ATCC 51263]